MMRRALAGAMLCLLVATAAGAQTRITGDPRAWEEVVAAFDRLGQARSYRVRLTTPGQSSSVLNEVVPPDRVRIVQQVGTITFEFITVGSETRMRILSTGVSPAWRCVPPSQAASLRPQQPVPPDAVTISRLGESAIDGGRVLGFQYTMTVQARISAQRLFILADGGLPRRLEALDGAGNVTAVVEYYDFNASITIELPRCT